jgi:hypothetical protein
MQSLVARFVVPDFDTWKSESFDPDPVGRRQLAAGHRLYRGVGNPNHVFLIVEFSSPEEARSFRATLSSPAASESAYGPGIENLQSWIAEEVEAVSYEEGRRSRKRRRFLRRKRRR